MIVSDDVIADMFNDKKKLNSIVTNYLLNEEN